MEEGRRYAKRRKLRETQSCGYVAGDARDLIRQSDSQTKKRRNRNHTNDDSDAHKDVSVEAPAPARADKSAGRLTVFAGLYITAETFLSEFYTTLT